MKHFFTQVILITENVMWTSTLRFYVTFSVRFNEVLASSSVMQNKLILLTNKLVYNQFIFQNICKWLLISFFPAHPEMIRGNGICNRFLYGIYSQIGTIEQGKFVFKHSYCLDAGNQKNQEVVSLGLFLHFQGCLIDSHNFYKKT